MNYLRLRGFVCLLAMLASACSWRSGGVEHYVGPVLFRYSAPPKGHAYVGQVIRLGIAAEAGTDWGIAVGAAERIAVLPVAFKEGQTKPKDELFRWLTPLNPVTSPSADDWHFSLIYLRVERPPSGFFISRSIYGAELVVGKETNAISMGAVSRNGFVPVADAFSMLHFESHRPMEARAKVWSDVSKQGEFPADLLEEIGK